jgi:hypothetical protein
VSSPITNVHTLKPFNYVTNVFIKYAQRIYICVEQFVHIFPVAIDTSPYYLKLTLPGYTGLAKLL